MLAVVLDTNSIHRDPWLTGKAAQKLRGLAEDGACVIIYPRVVIDELYRQRLEAAQRAHNLAAEGLAEMAKAGVDVAETSAGLAANMQRISSDLDDAFANLLRRNNVVAAAVPNVAAQDLLRRDLDRRRPFMEIEVRNRKKSLGFRDVLIWETVLELLEAEPCYDLIYFVSSDTGFLGEDSKDLHPHLLDDLDGRRIERKRIRTVKSIPNVISDIEAEVARSKEAAGKAAPGSVEESAARATQDKPESSADSTLKPPEDAPEIPTGPARTEPGEECEEESAKSSRETDASVLQADLVTAATDALYGLANRDISMQAGYGGDYDYPDFVRFTMPNIESGFLSYIDQTTEFTFRQSRTSPDVLVGSADAVLTIEGAIFKGDWFAEDADSFNIVGDLNDHYFETSIEVEVRAVVELDIEGGRIDVLNVMLEDRSPQADAAGNLLEFEMPDGPPDGARD